MRLAVVATAAVIGGLLASPASAESLFERADACLAAPDRPICLLRAAVADGRGDVVENDPDLRRRSDLLAAAGVQPKAALAPTPGDRTARAIERMGGLVADAFKAASAGRPAAEALAPIVAPPAAGEPDLRLVGLNLIVLGALGSENRSPDQPFVTAALQAWEEGLQAGWNSELLLTPEEDLAGAYARFGDEAGLERALRLIRSPDRRVDVLLDAGRLDNALALAAEMTPQVMASALRDEAARDTGRVRLTDADLKRTAGLVVRNARLRVVAAMVKAGRPQPVRGMADAILAATPPKSADETVLFAAGPLATAATPAVATAWLEQLDGGFTRLSGTSLEASSTLQGRIAALIAGWRALGRDDRIDALAAQLRPLAERERAQAERHPDEAIQTPAAWQLLNLLLAADRAEEARALRLPQSGGQLIGNDILRGRGIVRLDDYLANASTEMDRISILVGCFTGSEQQGAFDDALTCHQRRRQILTRPEQQIVLMDAAIRTAGLAADADQPERARTLLAFALDAGLPDYRANPQFQSMAGFSSRRHLVQIAKAELRAQGRLPPRARPKTMLGPPP